MEQDKYGVYNNGKLEFTLRKIAAIGDFEIPPMFEEKADIVLEEIAANKFLITPPQGCTWLLFTTHGYTEEQKALYLQWIERGVIIISENRFIDKNGIVLPSIHMSNRQAVRAVWRKIGLYIRNLFNVPTITVTGSMGKTTTTRFIELLLSERARTFVSGGNLNTPDLYVRQMLKRFDESYGFHVQECGAGHPGLAAWSASTMEADVFCITNIVPDHLDQYKTIEAVEKDKTSFDLYSRKDAVGIINLDDERLRNFKFNHRVITCGIEHTEADYTARSVRQNGFLLEMEIVHEGVVTPIAIRIPGLHNAYNALMAFAVAKEYGLTEEEIVRGFKKYRSDIFRQNLAMVAGRILHIDCFSYNPTSTYTTVKSLNEMSVPEGGQKIAIISGANKLGEHCAAINYELGLKLSKLENIDKFVLFCYSMDPTQEEQDHFGHAKALYDGLCRNPAVRKKCVICMTCEEGAEVLRATKPGDAILFKGGIYRPQYPMIDLAFGTSYTCVIQYSIREARFNTAQCIADYYAEINGCTIVKWKEDKSDITIPDTIQDKPVHRLATGVFANNQKLKTIDFGSSVMNIGKEAFKCCTGLESLTLPYSALHLEMSAFEGCSGLKEVSMKGIYHIGERAFANCPALKRVELSECCAYIEEDAFVGSDNVTIVAPLNSYAMTYALKNGIRYEISE